NNWCFLLFWAPYDLKEGRIRPTFRGIPLVMTPQNRSILIKTKHYRASKDVAIMCVAITATRADTETIRSACNTAAYKSHCISSLSGAPGALNASLPQLAVIVVELGIAESKRDSSFIESLKEKNPGVLGMEDCIELFNVTGEQLHKSVVQLRRWSGPNFKEYVAYVQTWLSAVADNPD
ncbi:hypothetical protein KI387_022737, partial [Taxus chinensis]